MTIFDTLTLTPNQSICLYCMMLILFDCQIEGNFSYMDHFLKLKSELNSWRQPIFSETNKISIFFDALTLTPNQSIQLCDTISLLFLRQIEGNFSYMDHFLKLKSELNSWRQPIFSETHHKFDFFSHKTGRGQQ